jgi:hypothetical protein
VCEHNSAKRWYSHFGNELGVRDGKLKSDVSLSSVRDSSLTSLPTVQDARNLLPEKSAMLRKTSLFVCGLFIGAIIGIVAVHFIRHRPGHDKWLVLSTEGKGFGWMSEALIGVDLPLPEVATPQGKGKFLDRNDIEKGTRLGYLVSTHIAHLDTTHIPAKYKVERKEGDMTWGATTEVVYSAHLEFTIKDADGFVLMTTKSPPLELWSGQENVLQGESVDEIPAGVVNRTRTIQMLLTADKCLTCRN